ncbi:MAG: hypothetical protein KJ788_13930 [Gammaproteobacteria bacterium]|nr:hypothetical protein [Gammaproteobacteria bacterium]
MEWIIKLLGLVIGYYVFRGMLGKSREGDMKIFLMLLGVFVAILVFRIA